MTDSNCINLKFEININSQNIPKRPEVRTIIKCDSETLYDSSTRNLTQSPVKLTDKESINRG